MSIFHAVRRGLRSLTRKLAVEFLIAGLAGAVFLSIFLASPSEFRPLPEGAGRLAAETGLRSDARIKRFMERVALSHVANGAAAPALGAASDRPASLELTTAAAPARANSQSLDP